MNAGPHDMFQHKKLYHCSILYTSSIIIYQVANQLLIENPCKKCSANKQEVKLHSPTKIKKKNNQVCVHPTQTHRAKKNSLKTSCHITFQATLSYVDGLPRFEEKKKNHPHYCSAFLLTFNSSVKSWDTQFCPIGTNDRHVTSRQPQSGFALSTLYIYCIYTFFSPKQQSRARDHMLCACMHATKQNWTFFSFACIAEFYLVQSNNKQKKGKVYCYSITSTHQAMNHDRPKNLFEHSQPITNFLDKWQCNQLL